MEMNLDITYRRIKAADDRCWEIVEELQELPSIEYCPQQTRGLNQEFLWSVTFIINQCNAILESDQYEDTSEHIDYRIQLTKFKEFWEDRLRQIT